MIEEGNRLGFYTSRPIKWDGMFWRPVPDSSSWFCWDPKEGGFLRRVPEDDVPDELFVKLMQEALL